MTCIVGLVDGGKVWIAGDSMASRGNESQIRGLPKVFKNGSFLIGYTGSPRQAQLIMTSAFNPPKQKDKQSDLDYLVIDFVGHIRKILRDHGAKRQYDVSYDCWDTEMLLGFNGKLYTIETDFQIGERTCGYNSVGCGSQYALGALHAMSKSKISPKTKLTNALKAAEMFDPFVQGPFDIKSMKK